MIRLRRNVPLVKTQSRIILPQLRTKLKRGNVRDLDSKCSIPVQLLRLLCYLKLRSLLFYITILVNLCIDGIEPAAPDVDDGQRKGERTYLSH